MKAQVALQKCLQTRLLGLQRRNPGYSLRAFARKLGMSPSALSEVLRGRRSVSRRLAARIAEKLSLDPQETHRLLQHFEENIRRPASASAADAREYLRLTADQFHLISEWTHYGILSLIGTDGFRPDTAWMAERLGVTPTKIDSSCERLLRLGLLERCEAGGFRRTYASVHTPDDVLNASLQNAHVADMEIAKQALADVPVEFRDFTSMTFPTSPALLPEAKKLVRRFREEMTALLESAPAKTEVYQMSVYVYPLTRLSKPKPKKTPGERK